MRPRYWVSVVWNKWVIQAWKWNSDKKLKDFIQEHNDNNLIPSSLVSASGDCKAVILSKGMRTAPIHLCTLLLDLSNNDGWQQWKNTTMNPLIVSKYNTWQSLLTTEHKKPLIWQTNQIRNMFHLLFKVKHCEKSMPF